MDWKRLSNIMPSHALSSNDSQPTNLTTLPPSLLDALIPGYSLISQYAQTFLGIDLSLFVTAGVLLFAVVKGSRWFFDQFEAFFRYWFMSSVYIDDGDDLFDMMMNWLDAQGSSSFNRSVRAKTQRGSEWDEATEGAAGEALDERGLFDYNKWAARTPPRYEPYYGRNIFWHEGTLFIFRRSRKPAGGAMMVNFGHQAEEDILQIDCIGRSPGPVKELLRNVKSWSLEHRRYMTTIKHPTPKERARYGGAWSRTSSRPSRPMETVILDAKQKEMIIRDMNEYLHPSSPKWYATRGIPYRRGYLFHGPPGTGKTSLSFALAGIFGLEIYAISLQEPTLTESDLLQLFNSLPKRCIVLLEDVDAAGLLRDSKSDPKHGKKKGKDEKEKESKDGENKDGESKEKKDDKETKKQDEKKSEDFTLKDLAKELKSISTTKSSGKEDSGKQGGHPNRAPGTGISLSGLLNAIDGVATHEGRVLIMTTNHAEKLDSALVRPGRVDRRVAFELAKKEQIRELFLRMYFPGDKVEMMEIKLDLKPRDADVNGSAKSVSSVNVASSKSADGKASASSLTRADLEDLALMFAERIPDDTFTPAEIQNHLMKYKNEPETALETAEQWQNDVLEEKERLRKKTEEDEAEDEKDGE